MLRFLILSVITFSALSHEHHGDESGRSCVLNPDSELTAIYKPGVVTVDGHVNEWADVEGSDFALLPALDPDQDKAYKGGKVTVKAVHDGNNAFFMLQVDGEYTYTKGSNAKCPSVALMFQVGENATYQDMGGCHDMPGTCTNKSCRGHEVDIMHFSLGSAIPGRLYGANIFDNGVGIGDDRFGHLVDVYAWNPHCRYLDGKGPSGFKKVLKSKETCNFCRLCGNSSNAQNDWHGAWWHSSLSYHSGFVEEDSPYAESGHKGTYYFEFSRPLRTMDRFQQDVQFVIGQASKMGVAFWYPNDGTPWSGSQHYSANCDWMPVQIASPSGTTSYKVSSSNSSWDAATAFALLMSFIAVCLSIFIGYFVSKLKSVPFTPIDRI